MPPAFVSCLAINPLQLPLRDRDGALGVFASGAVVGEHIDDQEVGDRGRRLFARMADAGSRQRTLAGVAEYFVLRVSRPDRRLVVGFEACG